MASWISKTSKKTGSNSRKSTTFNKSTGGCRTTNSTKTGSTTHSYSTNGSGKIKHTTTIKCGGASKRTSKTR